MTVLMVISPLSPDLQAQSPLVTIDTVTVGDAGNTTDASGYGAVSNVFAIGKYEVTIGQYVTFLNSVATSDPYSLYNSSMASFNNNAGILRSGSEGAYLYSAIGPFGATPAGAVSASNRPISFVSWFDAARFANWINNGATNGADTETGAYTLSGATNGVAPGKNPGASWWIPTEDEWYKAAYYKSGGTNASYWLYPTQSDQAPGNSIGSEANQANYQAGDYAVTQSSYDPSQNYLTEVGTFINSASAYGTFDQAGNLQEWNDLSGDASSLRGYRGGDWNNNGTGLPSTGRDEPVSADFEYFAIGFRVATVPEPSTYALLLLSGAASLWALRRRKS